MPEVVRYIFSGAYFCNQVSFEMCLTLDKEVNRGCLLIVKAPG